MLNNPPYIQSYPPGQAAVVMIHHIIHDMMNQSHIGPARLSPIDVAWNGPVNLHVKALTCSLVREAIFREVHDA